MSISIHDDSHQSEVSHFWMAPHLLAYASAGLPRPPPENNEFHGIEHKLDGSPESASGIPTVLPIFTLKPISELMPVFFSKSE
jgi:hypothetical protein